ncbi:MAG: hypothetical protein LLG16_05875 [Euryarchaeota archaeon]|nr:hypothetical protein [Euryarchaeota archaeon]
MSEMTGHKTEAPSEDRLSLRGNGIILLVMAFIALMVMFIEIMLVQALPGIAMVGPVMMDVDLGHGVPPDGVHGGRHIPARQRSRLRERHRT